MKKKAASVFVVSPCGERIGPFKDYAQAAKFGREKWPDSICGNRDTDPDCWEVRVSTRDQPNVPPEAA